MFTYRQHMAFEKFLDMFCSWLFRLGFAALILGLAFLLSLSVPIGH